MPTWLLRGNVGTMSGYLLLHKLYSDCWRRGSVAEICVLSKALLMLCIILYKVYYFTAPEMDALILGRYVVVKYIIFKANYLPDF
jgi:hypothetical protein